VIYTPNLLVELLRQNVKCEGSYREESRAAQVPYLVDDCSYEELRILVPLNIVLVLRGFQMLRYFNHAQKKGF
jgi:hypothetical protein